MRNNSILILCSFDFSLIHFRGDFIKSLLENNFEVFCAAPDMTKEISEKLIALGASPLTFKLQRTGLNPFKDLQSIFELNKLIKKHNIGLVFPYTIKPVIYGSIAANFAKVPVISLITGLGFTFSGASLKAIVLQKVTEFLYKISIRKNKLIIFQNSDDHQLFIDRNIITKEKKVGIVDGSGVNLGKYPNRVNNNTSDKIIFTLVARLIEEKGVNLYIEAAEEIKMRFPNAEFHIIGRPDQSPSAINMEKLNQLHDAKIIVYHGQQDNVPKLLYASDIFVLPTFYREGIPRSILEALSVGMPVITTDSPGCRETVNEGKNGFLIKPQSLEDLKRAMGYFLENPIQIKEMGIASRALAEKKFNVDIINDHLIALIKETMTK
jgi:glycosyltransferase involved in cell wall biosynthesis